MRPTTRHLTPARTLSRAALTVTAAALLTGLAAPTAGADPDPSAASRAAADKAATAPAAMETLTRFFDRDGTRARVAGEPRVDGEAVPVYHLSRDFAAGKRGAPIAEPVHHASRAVSADGRTASLWTARHEGVWQVVNIATGDDETRYTALGERRLPGGTVFQEPQIGAWFVQRDARVVPLDKEARTAVGTDGTSLNAYRDRVRRAYGDKLPGSAYAKSGKAGGYGPAQQDTRPDAGAGAPARAAAPDDPLNVSVAVASGAAGVGLLATLLWAGAALRRRVPPGR
ncbi:hypothetical protein [Streptomyces uncialis]|uniref:hypothetical protein n=1 Tax=Streptomyces uncialis TaxID=1048205 RepID=UPI00386D584A|nr:hypothetical protein OG924_08170 [Streptomyces uncialis]